MSRAIHFISKAGPGHGASDGSCLPCSGVSGSVVCVSPCSSRAQYKHSLKATNLSLQCTSRNSPSICGVSSGGHRRNPDFSRQNKHGFSRNRNRQNEDREIIEESDVFSSKNGPLLTSSGSPKFQATAIPGPREKVIVDLFRKVQAQLRERAAVKEERKLEESQKKGKEGETVDSLLKLLRKHSIQQGRRSSDSDSSRDFISDQPERNGMFSEERNTSIFDSNSGVKHDKRENVAPVTTRPRSNFWRRSPVPQIEAQPPMYADEDNKNSISGINFYGKGKQRTLEPELEVEPDNESAFSDGHVFDGMLDDEIPEIHEDDNSNVSHQNEGVHGNLSEMKLTELRALAKSQGLRGFSKLKKRELIDLLSGGSI